MADEVDSVTAAPSGDDPPGVRLRAARKEQGRTTRDIAATLNMDAWMLDAIERDEYSALGAPVFAKGHLRKYASTLGIDPDDLMVGYYEVTGPRETPPLIADSILRAEASRPASYSWVFPTVVIAAAVVAVAAAALWYLRSERPSVELTPDPVARDAAGDAPVRLALPAPDTARRTVNGVSTRTVRLPPPATTVPEATPDGAAAEPEAGATDDADDDGARNVPEAAIRTSPARDEPAPAEPLAARTQPASAPPQSTPAEASQLRLTLRFRTDSWVEVYDAKRRKMLYGMGAAGTTQNLNGPAPLQVFLGRYTGVDIEVNGEPFTIPRAARRTNTARFRIEQPSG